MKNKNSFIQIVKDFYKKNYRPMAWRNNTDPYYVYVSEVMLQQTQVDRVRIKFAEFIEVFPTVQDLAEASLKDVLAVWKGLGYNRRGMWLHEAAQRIVGDFDGEVPDNLDDLMSLKGIGHNTAAAILVYAFNKPVVFVETNIRAVYIHHFFNDRDDVSDDEVLELVEATLDQKNPREWYWALMDYGTQVKKEFSNPARRSKHHSIQSRFEGSRRQARGQMLSVLLDANGPLGKKDIADAVESDRDDLDSVLEDLVKEGLVVKDKSGFSIS